MSLRIITIESIQDLLNQLQVLPEFDFFRGQSSVDYKLIPSIGRLFSDENKHIIKQFEKEIFDSFKLKYSLYSDVRPNNDFEFLFLAQHHGLPTRLLDWTYNPLVALYFATCSDFDKDGCVYHAFPSKTPIYDHSIQDPFSITQNYSVTPQRVDVRYRNQNGLFVMYAKPHLESLDKLYCKYIIPAAYKECIQWKLRKIGIARSFIYPSLDSVCAEIMDIHHDRYKCYEK